MCTPINVLLSHGTQYDTPKPVTKNPLYILRSSVLYLYATKDKLSHTHDMGRRFYRPKAQISFKTEVILPRHLLIRKNFEQGIIAWRMAQSPIIYTNR